METVQVIRDVAIIILAVETIVVGAATTVLVWQVWKLVTLVKSYVEPIGGSAKEILVTVKQTTEGAAKTARHTQATVEFIADRTAKPVIDAYSVVFGASRFARAVFRGGQAKKGEDA